MILDAAVPLLVEYGAEVTTRQIADAAGIAEGTLFRVFDDKQALVDAAVVRFMNPQRLVERIQGIDPTASLECKLLAVAELSFSYFKGISGIFHALGLREPPAEVKQQEDMRNEARLAVARLLEPHRDELTVEPAAAVHYVRLMCFAAGFPSIPGVRDTSAEEIVDVILHGVAKKGH